jgi:hypothetical protein
MDYSRRSFYSAPSELIVEAGFLLPRLHLGLFISGSFIAI